MKNPKLIFAIDPDLHQNGVAIFDTTAGKLTDCHSVTMWALFDQITANYKMHGSDILFLLEVSGKSYVWHGGKTLGAKLASAQNVGKNKGVSIVLKEFFKAKNIPVTIMQVNGYTTYFTATNFKIITGHRQQTNKDSRAAAAMIYKNGYHKIKT